MNKLLLLICTVVLFSCHSSRENTNNNWLTPFENGNGNQTATYEEIIDFYNRLDHAFSTITVEEIGKTDSGEPLHLVTYSKKPVKWSKDYPEKIKLLINNGIHPGESDGIDATMMLIRDLATEKIEASEQLILNAIAIYNVGGSLNRNSHSRTNQNGPESYGFRGNARNYDLNRDFIKADTRNTQTFYDIFHRVQPDLFIDNHVSNGADYQYTITHLFTQHDKLGSDAGSFLYHTIQPELEKRLQSRELDITPYVNIYGKSPENGFSQFMDHPRYSTGFTTLWNCYGMMIETHMLKPYKERVYGTKAIMEELINIGNEHLIEIKESREATFNYYNDITHYVIDYKVDSTKVDTINFKGYKAVNKISKVTGNTLLTYDRNNPVEKDILYYNHYIAVDSIKIPEYYILPNGWWQVEDLLRRNNIQMEYIKRDTTLTVTQYRIKNYKTSTSTYEGHYPHSNVVLSSKEVEFRFRESDILIPTRQLGIRYIIETLEPEGQDSFFKWNYFDTILQQKESFSSYVFEKTALKMLRNDISLQKEFDSVKIVDPKFAASNYEQLKWLHRRSPNYEKTHLNYPIFKWNPNE